MNTKDIYSLQGKKNSRTGSSLKTILLSAVMLAGATASYAIGTPPVFVHGTAQTMAVCEDAVPTQINSLLTVNDPNTGETETWTIIGGPAHGTIVTGSTATVVGGAATPTGFTYMPDGGYSGTDVFTVEVNDGSNTATTTITVTVNPLPAVQTFTGGGGYCVGGSGVHIGLTLTEPGVSYQLYESPATAVGAPVTGTGGAIDFGTYTNANSYYAIASNGGCTTSLPGVTVHVDPLPDAFAVTGGGDYCIGGTGIAVGLSGSVAGVSYQLYENGNPVGSPVAGTGSAIDFGLQAATGDYTVIATDNTTGCVNNMAGSVTVGTLPLPSVFNVIGGGYYCLGGAGVPIMLDGSETDVNYQLVYLGFIPLNSAVPGTGDTVDFGVEYLPGNYTVYATNTNTGCISTMNNNATLYFSLPPFRYNVTQTNGGEYCVGGTGVNIGLSYSSAGISYQLYHEDTAVGMPMTGVDGALDFGAFTTTGTYKVIATNTTSGCTSTMNGTSVVVVNPLVIPTVNITSGIGSGSDVCYGSIATFTAQTTNGGTAPTYEWMVNNLSVPGTDSTYTYTPVDGEVLSVIVHSNASCATPDTASDRMTVNVDTLLAPSIFLTINPTTTSVAPGTSVTITAVPAHGGPTPTFVWYKNGVVIPGATTNTYTSNAYLDGDSVSVRMTSSGGCGGVVAVNSVVITVFATSVANVAAAVSDVKLIPNPNRGAFSITGTLATRNDAEVAVEITNLLGQVVYTGKVIAKDGVINEQVQLNTITNGMYILSLKAAGAQSVVRFVVEK